MAQIDRTNEEWLADLRDDSPNQAAAFKDLRRYVQRGILAYLRSRSDLGYLAHAELEQMSEDFTQEALLKVKDNLDTFRGNSKLTTWASKIGANHTISELRRAKWRDLSLDMMTDSGTSLQEILPTPNGGDNPDTKNEQQEVWQTISGVIENELTDRQRKVLVATQIEGVPMAEVARVLETNTNNIYKLLYDARLKLKRELQGLGMNPDYILQLFSQDA